MKGTKGKHWKLSEITKKRQSLAKTGIKLSEQAKNKISLANKGQVPWNKGKKNVQRHSKETREKMSKSHLGKKWKIKNILKISGSNSYLWKGGLTQLDKQIRHCYKYRQWRSDVFTRDDFTCQECNRKGIYLEAHHIKMFSKIIKENNIKTLEEALNCEELWNINNGKTLCLDCHNKLPKHE